MDFKHIWKESAANVVSHSKDFLNGYVFVEKSQIIPEGLKIGT